jgi:hypothetical protein
MENLSGYGELYEIRNIFVLEEKNWSFVIFIFSAVTNYCCSSLFLSQKKRTLLPLKRMEATKFISTTQITLLATEKKKLVGWRSCRFDVTNHDVINVAFWRRRLPTISSPFYSRFTFWTAVVRRIPWFDLNFKKKLDFNVFAVLIWNFQKKKQSYGIYSTSTISIYHVHCFSHWLKTLFRLQTNIFSKITEQIIRYGNMHFICQKNKFVSEPRNGHWNWVYMQIPFLGEGLFFWRRSLSV